MYRHERPRVRPRRLMTLCSECKKHPTPNSFTFTCSTACSEARNRRLTRERSKARRGLQGGNMGKDTAQALPARQKPPRKLCGYCRGSFTPRASSHSYCSSACGQAARKNQKRGYDRRTPVIPKHITRALDRFGERYGTRVPAEVPGTLDEWCQLLGEAA
jgi:hypothetical protein